LEVGGYDTGTIRCMTDDEIDVDIENALALLEEEA